MTYTVNKLAKLSGVSIRTLHYYDEIGLLKPALRQDNNYRYYEEEQLLILQQILFFRELGFPLNDIQKILSSDDFDKIGALQSHKKILIENLERTKKLLNTIDKTISHLTGNKKIIDKEMYEGFDPVKQKEYEKYLIDSGKVSQQLLEQGKEAVKNWTKEDWEKFHKEGDEINKALVILIQENFQATDQKVQAIIQRHYNWVKRCWTPTRESYVGLSQLYGEHNDFRVYYESYHPKMVEFLGLAMRIFAEQRLL
jgi:DNA-binding transcriptional MerR regulator